MMEQHLRYLIELSFLKPGSRWSVMGAYIQEGTTLLLSQGYLLGDGDFDGVLAVQAFYNKENSLQDAAKLLRKGGKLVFSDVTGNILALLGQLRSCGFAVRHMEDLSDAFSSLLPSHEHTYILFICERM